MFRFSLLRTIRTKTRALPPRRNRSGCRPNLETLEDRTVPAGQIITVGTGVGQVDLPTAISQSNMDAANTSPGDPDIIHFATGYTPPQLEGAVQNTGNLKIMGSVAIDDFSSLTNSGTLEVVGDLSIGHTGSIDGDMSDLSNGVSNTDSAKLTVDGALTMGDDATIENWGTSSISVSGQLSFGEGGIYYNGGLSLDALNSEAAVSLTAGSFVMDTDALVYNEGTSSISISSDLTLGDGSSEYYNGLTDSSTASLAVGGNISIGETAFLITYGHSQAVVGGNVTLGSNSSLENGVNLDLSQTDAASFTVDGNLSLGDASDPLFDNDQITNTAGSSITVHNNLTIYGQEDSMVLNGAAGSSGGTITVGGQFSMAATGYFQDYGTLIVSGPFDAGTGNPSHNDLIAGVFGAGAGSSVTTNTAVWEVTGGGVLDVASTSGFLVAAGGTLKVDFGGTLTVDGGGAITIAGLLTVDGVVDPPSTMTVQGNGVVNVDAGGSLSVGNLIVTDSAAVSVVGQATLTCLVASGSATVDVSGSLTTGSVSLQNPNQLTQEPGSTVVIGTPPSKQNQTITFNPLANVPYSTASGSVALSASASSSLAVTFTFVQGGAYASISGSTLTIQAGTTAGTVIEVEADQAGDSTYNAAVPVDQSFTISQALQSITFNPLPNITTSSPSFTLSATASSGFSVSYTAVGNVTLSQSGSVWTVQPTGAGIVTITAHQVGNANYAAAGDVSQTFTISAAGTTVVVPSGQQYTYTDPNGNQVAIKATGGATTTLSFQTVSGTRVQLNSIAVTGSTSTTGLTITASGATTVNNLTIAGSAIHDINLGSVTVNGFATSVPMHDLVAGSLRGSIQLTGGGYDVAVGSIGTSSGTAAVTLSGGFHNVAFGLVLSGSTFTLVGMAHDLAFGDIATGATVSLGTSAQSAAIHDFVGGIISGSLLVYDTFQDGVVLGISGHVYLKSIGGAYITVTAAAGPWVGADLKLVGGGDILLGTIGDKSKVFAL